MTTTQKPSAITVVDFMKVEKPGNLKAFVSVRIGPALIVHKCRVIQQPAQKAWVSMPQERWEDKEGKAKYSPIVELFDALKVRVERAILAEAKKQGVIG